MTTRDVALELLTERALDKQDQRLLRPMTKRVGLALVFSETKARVTRSRAGPVHALGIAR